MDTRNSKVSKAVRRALLTTIQDIDDERLGFLTVTGVKVSQDASHATVLYSVLGPVEEREVAQEVLEAHQAELQAGIASLVRMRRTPRLTFRYDEQNDEVWRIEKLLKEGETDA